MAISITFGMIDKDDVIVELKITMSLKDWKAFYQELSTGTPLSIQMRDALLATFNKIK